MAGGSSGSAATTGATLALGEAPAAVCSSAAASATPTAAPSMKGDGAMEVGGKEKGEHGAEREEGEATPRAATPSARLPLRFPELPLLMGVVDALPATLAGASAGVLLCRLLPSSWRVARISWKVGRAEGSKQMQRRMTSASAGGASAGTSKGSWPARSRGRGQRRGGGG